MIAPQPALKRRGRWIVVAIVLVLVTCWWMSSKSELELKAESIRAGMTRQQVLALLGQPAAEADCEYHRRADDVRLWNYLAFRARGYNLPGRLHEWLWNHFPAPLRVIGVSYPNPSSLFSVEVYLNQESDRVELVRIRQVERW
jgi:hypothetical protein